MWVEGEMVNMEDIVINDELMDRRKKRKEMNIENGVMRMRRKIERSDERWEISKEGMKKLMGSKMEEFEKRDEERKEKDEEDNMIEDIDEILESKDEMMEGIEEKRRKKKEVKREKIIYDEEWEEEERLKEWRD